MTTFELTALTFSLTMLVTSICWYAKPTILRPVTIYTRDARSIAAIRAAARATTHPNLPEKWYRTPLAFISQHKFQVDIHWSYYSQLTFMMNVPLFGRQVKARPWDRIPSDTFLAVDRVLLAPGFIVVVVSSLSLLVAWNFHFPTEAERLAWRICSVYDACFSIVVVAYYISVSLEQDLRRNWSEMEPEKQQSSSSSSSVDGDGNGLQRALDMYSWRLGDDAGSLNSTGTMKRSSRSGHKGEREEEEAAGAVWRGWLEWIRGWRNIDPDGDPDMEIPLRVTLPILVGTFLYIFCRLFFYVEDVIAIRSQPADVYKAMNKFIPFMN
jgi:hypothetical protein